MLTIDVQNLTKRFGRLPVLDHLTLTLEDRESVVLYGSNGAGKTTLLRILGNLITPTSGEISILGMNYREEAEAIRKSIGFLSHATFLYNELTALENLRFFSRLYGLTSNETADRLLERVGLADRRNTPVKTFSRGMQQRLALARTLLHDPAILLLDEPYTGLDPKATGLLDEVLHDPEHKRLILIVTHDVEHGLAVTDRYLVLRRGRIAASGESNNATAVEIKKQLN